MSTCKRMWTDREVRSMAVNSVEKKSDLKVFEHIVDKDGHKRFVEGDITIEEITGIAKTYGKWSLSGSHLMMVIALSLADETVIAGNTTLAYIDVPQWVKDKVVKILPESNEVARGSFIAFSSNAGSTQSLAAYLRKPTDSQLVITLGSLTLNTDKFVRLQFDLLIDNA